MAHPAERCVGQRSARWFANRDTVLLIRAELIVSGLEFRSCVRSQEWTTRSVVRVGAQKVVFAGHVGSSPIHQKLKISAMHSLGKLEY